MTLEPLVVPYICGDDPPTAELYYGIHVLDALRSLKDNTVHCVCTSPPYYGLRNYETPPQVWGGDPECPHEWGEEQRTPWANAVPGPSTNVPKNTVAGGGHWRSKTTGPFCQKCGAWLGQLGQEPTPDLYVQHLVEVFREVRRVLRPDGTLWLNLGDSYVGGGSTTAYGQDPRNFSASSTLQGKYTEGQAKRPVKPRNLTGLKTKDLMGIPWRVAFALQTDGWTLRRDIIWSKESCMPESVRDRPTTSHEYVFLLAQQEHYFYDHEAIKEPHKFNRWGDSIVTDAAVLDAAYDGEAGDSSLLRQGATNFHPEGGRNKRSVWNINPQAYKGAHFACWPPALAEIMIKAGTGEKGCCSGCGQPLRRVVDRETCRDLAETREMPKTPLNVVRAGWRQQQPSGQSTTKGWERTCSCSDTETSRCVVLDPFSGSATTGKVALSLGRDYIGIDLNASYLELAVARIQERPAPDIKAEKQETENPFSLLADIP